ncbi:hypothetical protein HGB25_03260 [Candidatus Saccharibacteria bacterium]|nr:hypothetical protein [Candidatus Saccharibacteria bacterium]
MNDDNTILPANNVKVFVAGFIGTLLLNIVSLFIFLMTSWSGGWGGGINIIGFIMMTVSFVIPLSVFCISIYLVKFKKSVKPALWNLAKGSMYCTLTTLIIMVLYALYIILLYKFVPFDF